MNSRIPEFIIFTGPMFGSKTTKLLASVDRFSRQSLNVMAFKPRIDIRYDNNNICTHSGGSLSAKTVASGDDIYNDVMSSESNIDVVAVDEAFMIEGVSDALIKLFKRGKTIVVSSLQLSATGKVFDEVMNIMPWATKIDVCPAVCPISGQDAFYTHKKFSDLAEIAVGGDDLYEPRSWFCHPLINHSQE